MTDNSSKSPGVLRAAIVGAGLMGRWHAHAVRRIGGAVSLIVDPDRKQALDLSQSHPGARVLSDLAAGAGLADVAHICTPPLSHESLAQQALESGMHALIEKPLTETSQTTEKLLGFAKSRGLLVCPVHQYLFQPGVLRAEEALARFGCLLHFDSLICSSGAETTAQSPERVAADILPGPLSLVVRLLGARMRQTDWQVYQPRPGELRANTSIEKTSVSVLISMRGRPTANSLRLIGELGTVHVDLFHGFSVLEPGKVSRTRKVAHPFTLGAAVLYSATTNLIARALRTETAYPGLRELIRRFYKAVHVGSTAPISPVETLDVALVRDQILREMRKTN